MLKFIRNLHGGSKRVLRFQNTAIKGRIAPEKNPEEPLFGLSKPLASLKPFHLSGAITPREKHSHPKSCNNLQVNNRLNEVQTFKDSIAQHTLGEVFDILIT